MGICDLFQKKDTFDNRSSMPPEQSGRFLRAVNLEAASGAAKKNLPYEDAADYILSVSDGEEDFLILKSQDGFLQFYGIDDQFVAEIRWNLPNKDFRTFSVVDKEKEHSLERILLTTPYGQFTPKERDVISLDLLLTVVRKYYENADMEKFIESIPCVETTEETKRAMGLIK